MASWRVAGSLLRLRGETNRKWPKRDRRSDGDIGDLLHRQRSSAHNPYAGFVHAIDIDRDGVDIHGVVRAAIAHPATNVVIFNRTIWSRRYGMRARRYTGSNPHTMHAHIEISKTAAARNSTQPWLGRVAVVKPTANKTPVVRPAPAPEKLGPHRVLRITRPHFMRGADVLHAQYKLNRAGFKGGQDSVYGPETESRIKRFQTARRLTADGVCGPATWEALRRVP